MARNLHAATITEITANLLRPAIFIEAQFVSGRLYLWTGTGAISWNGQTWTGAGSLLALSPLQETADVAAQGMQFALSGIPSDLIAKALTEIRQGAPVIVWQGFLTEAGAVVANPYKSWSGRMDTCTVDEGPEACRITISAESRLMDLNRSRELRYTKQSQETQAPGDLGFDFVPNLQELNLTWGGDKVPVG